MAKIMKDTRQTMDVNTELENIKKSNEKKNVTEKSNKKVVSKKNKNKDNKNVSKKHFKFFKEVKNELDKVKWPSKKDMVKYSIATIVFIIFFAVFFYLIDLIIALLKAGV